MLDFLRLAINKPSHAILVALSTMVVYLGLGQMGIKEALAGIHAKQESYSVTETRVYETHKSVAKMEAQLDYVAQTISDLHDHD